MRKAAVRKTARKGDGPRGAKLLGDFASYLISSEILLCPTAPPSTVPLFLLFQTPPPSPFLRPALLATTLPGAFTATSFTISKGQCASLSLSPSEEEEEEQGGTYCSLWSFLCTAAIRSRGKSARSCRSDGRIFTLSRIRIRGTDPKAGLFPMNRK